MYALTVSGAVSGEAARRACQSPVSGSAPAHLLVAVCHTATVPLSLCAACVCSQGLDTDAPTLRVQGRELQGQFEQSLGSVLVFRQAEAAAGLEPGALQYLCHTETKVVFKGAPGQGG